MSYDSKCYDLAEHFLGSHPEGERIRKALAQHVQDCVEGWIEMEADRIKADLGRPLN